MSTQVNFLVKEAQLGRTISCTSFIGGYKRIFIAYNGQTDHFSGSGDNAKMLTSQGKDYHSIFGKNPVQLTITGLHSSVVHGVALDYAVPLSFGPPTMKQGIKYAYINKIEYFVSDPQKPLGFIEIYIPVT